MISNPATINSTDPAKISTAMMIGYHAEKPSECIYTPYAMPKNKKPDKMGKLWVKAYLAVVLKQ